MHERPLPVHTSSEYFGKECVLLMDLHSGKSCWIDTLPAPPVFPALDQDVSCDVVIVGAGSSGALCANELVSHGLDVIVVDKRKAASGSSCVNTGLLQYVNDKPLSGCINTFGTEKAVRFYTLCREAIDELENLCSNIEGADFLRRESLYLASLPEDAAALKKECLLLKKHGFDTEYWDEHTTGSRFTFNKAALYSRGDAEMNPYRFVYGLLTEIKRHGARIYEHTEVKRHTTDPGGITFYTDKSRIRAQYAVIASGYETQERIANSNAVISSTFAIATQPLDRFPDWPQRCLIWESARPYVYIRTTADNRIIAGGFDERTNIPEERNRVLPHKAVLLLERLRELFPRIPELHASYSWSAAFGSTHDGLPMIGSHPSYPRCYFALGYGGNGTVYSKIAASIISGLIVKGGHPDAELVRVDRSSQTPPLSKSPKGR